jgi:NAD(P)-dependent dehydrogenase (short-subunit alcohol dehydrogenase family)
MAGGYLVPIWSYAQDFVGLRALVTGGAQGIGRAAAGQLAARGAAVAVLDVAETGPAGFHYVRADITDDAAVRTGVADVIAVLGGLDVLVNNAGIVPAVPGGIEAHDDDVWRHIYDVNVIGIVRVTRAALSALRRSEHAAIVNLSSITALTGLPQRAAYTATKGAILSLSRTMASDMVADGIRVNSVSPGTTRTPMLTAAIAQSPDPAATEAAFVARQPLGLVGAEEIAAAICYLASPLSASTTGIDIAVDGGATGLRDGPRG